MALSVRGSSPFVLLLASLGTLRSMKNRLVIEKPTLSLPSLMDNNYS